MKNQKIKPLLKGFIKHFPFVKKLLKQKTGGTINSKYCYSVWMRHLINLHTTNTGIPKVVAELGPGDSLGIGFAALLSGCEKIYAFDVIKYWDNERNVKIFDELVALFKQKATIPGSKEFPLVKPEIDNYFFPSNILSQEHLDKCLAQQRIEAIRNEIINIDNPNNQFIAFQIPWHDSKILEKNSVDFIFSQAVLQHVEQLENTYQVMSEWLKPSGIMSHTIDFKSMGITEAWNGHWTFSDWEWNMVRGGVRGGNSFLINRQPFTTHIALHEKNGFKVLKKAFINMKNELSKKQLSKRFSILNEEELTTSGMYILSQKSKLLSLLTLYSSTALPIEFF